jgi:hypothetical protein
VSQIKFWGNIGSLLPWLGISERDVKGEKGRSSGGEEAIVLADVTLLPLLAGGAEE